MALSIDGTPATGQASSASTVSATVTVPTAGDIIVAYIFAEWTAGVGTFGVVSGVSGGGLTWAKRSGVTLSGGQSGSFSDAEVWWAYSSGTLTAQVITATFTKPSGNNFDDADIVVFGVTGFTGSLYHTTPWDPNGTLPAIVSTTASSNPTVNATTTNLNAMILGFVGSVAPGAFTTPGTGYTAIAHIENNGATNRANIACEFQDVGPAQSSLAVGYTTGGTNGWSMIGDALNVAGGIVVVTASPRLNQYLRR